MDNLINIAFKNRHLCYYISSYNLLLLYVLYIWTIYMKYPFFLLLHVGASIYSEASKLETYYTVSVGVL